MFWPTEEITLELIAVVIWFTVSDLILTSTLVRETVLTVNSTSLIISTLVTIETPVSLITVTEICSVTPVVVSAMNTNSEAPVKVVTLTDWIFSALISENWLVIVDTAVLIWVLTWLMAWIEFDVMVVTPVDEVLVMMVTALIYWVILISSMMVTVWVRLL